MNGQERFRSLIRDRRADRTGFWMGNPHPNTLPGYLRFFGAADQFAMGRALGDDFRWLPAELMCWPEGVPCFDPLGGRTRESLNQDGIFAECETVAEIERYRDWPDPARIDLDRLEKLLDETHAAGMATVSGTWSCFFHIAADYFGMENYFVKMHTCPEVVEAATEHIVAFYMEANRRVFERLAGKIDAFFFGNDFGTQLDLLISPACFRKFVLPSTKRLIGLAKRYGLPVMLHSCGAIKKAIPDLIEAGVDALHPLQALAKGMDAESLRAFKDDLLFVGGVDTQRLLPFGSPGQVREAVLRLRDTLGPGLVVSPSHEALLPNVRAENLVAMRDAATE